jgi:hypothetical protein
MPLISTPIRRYWPAWWPGQGKLGRITTVEASDVSGWIRSIVPVNSRVDHNGFISAM